LSWSKYPSVDEAEQVVLAIASDEWDEDLMVEWLGEHLVLTRSCKPTAYGVAPADMFRPKPCLL
jgi:hypothetical protein